MALPQYRFPRDNPQDYKGVIEFRVVEITPPTVTGFNSNAITDIFNIIAEDAPANNGPSFERGGRGSTDTARTLSDRVEIESPFPNVTLYLPQDITFADGIEFDTNVELGIMGAVAERSLNSGGSLTDAIKTAAQSGISSITDLFKDTASPDLARLMISRAASNVNTTAGNVASSALRVVPNPNRRTLFRAVRAREFAFVFTMIANSPAEAQEIANIITFFREQMYPASINVGGISAGLKYPNPFKIYLKYNNFQVGTKILNSYITNMNVTYNPTSMGYHIDGKPSEVRVALNFSEERPLTRDDIYEGY